MNIETALIEFSKTMIKDLGKKDGRAYLLRNVSLWRQEYGETVTRKVVAEVRKMLGEAG